MMEIFVIYLTLFQDKTYGLSRHAICQSTFGKNFFIGLEIK